MRTTSESTASPAVQIPIDDVTLEGELVVPAAARAIVIFAHGSGHGRGHARERRLAQSLVQAGFATLTADLLTPQEVALDATSLQLRLDVGLLASRLTMLTDWVAAQPAMRPLRIGFLGDDTGSAAALIAATMRPDAVGAIVSRGGRPDLAGDALGHVRAPTLLVVGGNDAHVASLNRAAMRMMTAAPRELVIVPRAGHAFNEPGAMEQVGHHARSWFTRYLGAAVAPGPKTVDERC
jgi:putative phosphoribosyl transferase